MFVFTLQTAKTTLYTLFPVGSRNPIRVLTWEKHRHFYSIRLGVSHMADFDETTSIDLPDSLVSRVSDRVRVTDFDDVDEYVAFVLEEVLWAVEDSGQSPPSANEAVNEEAVEERLESLGYLNE
jgi:Arc/MetJ-type ribon-helix-helix transcriptional regulator